MIDISYIIKDPDFAQKFNVKRFKFLLEKGRFISQKVLDLSVKGVILPYMPLVRKHNEMLFETVNGSVTIYSQENLYGMALDEVKEESVVDFIYFNGNWWQIVEVRPYDSYGFISATAKMFETQQQFKEINDELHQG